jgi:flagellar biosynthetic protein FlhB
MALRIRELAEEYGVPIVEDRPLARALFATSEVGEVIPQQYYSAVAIILATLQKAGAGARA